MSEPSSPPPSGRDLSAAKRALLEKRLRGEAIASQAEPVISPRLEQGPALLSFAQRRLWFLDQLQPGSSTYNIPILFRLTGPLNITALEQSLNEIIQRHAVLRTQIIAREGRPQQVTLPGLTVGLSVQDLRYLPADMRPMEARRQIAIEAFSPFYLAHGPLVRAAVLITGEQEFLFLVSVHHIVFDGWSEAIFFKELSACYAAFSSGSQPALPPLSVQYADYAAWQRSAPQEVLQAQMAYWKEKLVGKLPLLELPADCVRPAVMTYAGTSYSFDIPQHLVESLRSIGQREGTTLFMTLLAAFKVLLYRYTGQTDLLVGAPVANRSQSQIENLIGFFVNTLVFRTDLSGEPSFCSLLKRVRQVVLEAFEHQEMPFEKLVEVLQPERDMGHTPLFQVMFSMQNTTGRDLQLLGLHVQREHLASRSARFDLTLAAVETNQSIDCMLEYNSDLFDPQTIERMAGHFITLLDKLMADPDQSIATAPLLTDPEKRDLLDNWNDTAKDYPQACCVHQLFEEQVRRTPQSVAAEFEGQVLTYDELNRRANQLAHHLKSLGVGKDDLVGILMKRSLELMVALLGVWKAGAAYVPLDPDYPAERLAFMMSDSQAKVLLTQSHLQGLFQGKHAVKLCLDDSQISDWPAITAQPDTNPNGGTDSHSLAYVIYTSGSTGRPKGVQIEQRSLVNFLTSMLDKPGLSQEDVVLAVTPISFDISGLELYLPLIVGARSVLVSRQTAMDGYSLARCLESSGVTLMQATPITWWLLIEAGWEGSPHLTALCGGEALSRDLAEQILPRVGRLWNMYGPTETTVWSTLEKVTSGSGPVCIGRPVANTQVYILDSHLQPVPVGVSGELYIGGDGLARGYLNRSEQTQVRFLANPFRNEVGERMYKTGDLARYRPGGAIEYLGRTDFQVKIRGFRIELGEIEAVLSGQADIQQAAVVARQDQPDAQRLVAYLVCKPELGLNRTDLQAYLKERLPAYMIPSAFVLLKEMPLTPNGKIDRKALPAAPQVWNDTRTDSPPPVSPGPAMPAGLDYRENTRNVIEVVLTRIWAEVLGLESVGIHDDFFQLGGHSLLAVRLMARIQQYFGKDLPVAFLFQHSTVEQIARLLEKPEYSPSPSSLVSIQVGDPAKPSIFLVHPSGGHVLCYKELARLMSRAQTVYGIQAAGLNGEMPPYSRMDAMAAYYIGTLQEVQPEGPYLLGGWSLGGVVAFEMARQLERQGQKVALLALFDSWIPAPGSQVMGLSQSMNASERNAWIAVMFLKDLALSSRMAEPPLSYDHLRRLPPDEQFDRMFEVARQVALLPANASRQHLHHLFEVYKGNLQAMYSYEPGLYGGEITLFSVQETEILWSRRDWRTLSIRPVHNIPVPGKHATILSVPHIWVLAEKLKACMIDVEQSLHSRK